MSQGSTALPVTALLAAEAAQPVVIFDGNAALRMAIVDRASVRGLGDSWDAPGVYRLLDPVDLDGAWRAYVGKAPAGIRERIRQHVRGKDHWHRALLVLRDTTHGWHSGQVGWLEGRLYDLLDGAAKVTIHNANRPQDETLPSYDRAALEAAVTPISAVLRFLGCSTDAEDDEPDATIGRRSPRQYNVSLRDLIQAGALHAGEHVVTVRFGISEHATLQSDGTLLVGTAGFPTVSAAGSHLLGGKPINGWDLWAVERDASNVPLATIRARHLRATESGTSP